MSPKIISVIPARGGSKGIIRKNVTLLHNRPLVTYTILQSLGSRYIDETYVSTDDQEIRQLAIQNGAKVIDRPSHLATDMSSTESALLHAANVLENDFDYMVLLQPTSPLRYSYQIDEAIDMILDKKGDSLLSACLNDSFLWDKNGKSINYDFEDRPRRQDKEWEYIENGSIYITKKKILLDYENRLGGKILIYEMPRWMSFEIDDAFDFELIEYLMKTKYVRSYKKEFEQLKLLRLVIFDVDGVFTDGSVYLDKKGNETLRFNRIDGKGIELLRNNNIVLAVISSEESEIVKNRMKKLKIENVFTGVKDKLMIYEQLKKHYSLEDEEICFLGDDVQDLEVIKRAGFSCCPMNAQQIIKQNVDYISPFKGGEGFVRDVCNLILNID